MNEIETEKESLSLVSATEPDWISLSLVSATEPDWTSFSRVSATEPDWTREEPRQWWDPARQLIQSLRRYQTWKKKGGILGFYFCKLSVLQHRFWSTVTGADIPLNCQIGGGFLLIHPNGVVIHPDATIGPNCLFLQQVTIVSSVKIGGHVDIGAGAKVIRPVTIGDHAKIGANAVVLCDVPPGATAVGVPARIVHLANPNT
jgi:serine O-acetyltransferase